MTGNDLKQFSQLLDDKLASSESKFDEKLAASERRVIGELGKFMEDNLFPMIEEKADKSDIDRLERKLDRVIDTSLDYESRIKDIEKIPAIAHALKAHKVK